MAITITVRMLENIAREAEKHGADALLVPDGLSLRLRRAAEGRVVTVSHLIDYDLLEAARKPDRKVGIALYQLEREMEHELARDGANARPVNPTTADGT